MATDSMLHSMAFSFLHITSVCSSEAYENKSLIVQLEEIRVVCAVYILMHTSIVYCCACTALQILCTTYLHYLRVLQDDRFTTVSIWASWILLNMLSALSMIQQEQR